MSNPIYKKGTLGALLKVIYRDYLTAPSKEQLAVTSMDARLGSGDLRILLGSDPRPEVPCSLQHGAYGLWLTRDDAIQWGVDAPHRQVHKRRGSVFMTYSDAGEKEIWVME